MNLVSNIGFGSDATHTTSESALSRLKTEGIKKIIHIETVERSVVADRYVFHEYFGGKGMVYPNKLLADLKKILIFICNGKRR